MIDLDGPGYVVRSAYDEVRRRSLQLAFAAQDAQEFTSANLTAALEQLHPSWYHKIGAGNAVVSLRRV